MAEKDVESGRPTRIPFFTQILHQDAITPEIESWDYKGAGTEEDPYIVTWITDDPRNPMLFSEMKKWSLTATVAIATLAVAFVSSAYSGGADQIIVTFGISEEVYTLGISFFVLGFALGPLIWAPLSELFGRQILYIITYGALTAFNAGAAGSQNIYTLIILRFFAGSFGSSPLTNAGGVIADMFSAKERGLAMALFAAAPFLGPCIGPVVGGFVGETIGWRWVEGIMAIFTGALWIIGTIFIPETYAPVLLRKRAAKLSKITGKVYISHGDATQGKSSFGEVFKASLSRPWILLFREPIVFLLSIYMAIIYGTLYMLFAAYPIVYQEDRGWSPGIGGLPFLAVAVGMVFAVIYSIWDNKRYGKLSDAHKGFAPPEARLPPAMVGGIAIPIGLFWFAWTNSPSLPWIASVAAGVPFGFGMVLVFLAILSYLIDAYVLFAASVLAANSVLRSLAGAAFPLFTSYMYERLGIHWASSIPAFLALMCVPMPFLFYKYGDRIRAKCKFAADADAFMRRMQQSTQQAPAESESEADEHDKEREKEEQSEREAERDREEQEALDYSYEVENEPRFEEIRTTQSRPEGRERATSYEGNPFDLDRVNTRESFKKTSGKRSRASSRASKK